MRRWLIFAAALLAWKVAAATISLNQIYELHVGKDAIRFNPIQDADLVQLQKRVQNLLKREDDESKHTRRGLEEIERLSRAILTKSTPDDRERLQVDLVETVLAVNNNERPPVPPHFDPIMVPLMLHQLSRPVGAGEKPACDLQPGPSNDLSRRDPLPSDFWSKPEDIPAEDLYNGFGRAKISRLTDEVWTYSAPKETTGMNPGFEVERGDKHVKLKFGEVSSEPVVTRMFWALGFHADPTDYSPGVKVAYDRRIFSEFNSRLPVHTRFTILWFLPIYSMNLQSHKDPFNHVAAAVLRDGRRWSGAELKQHLMSGTNFQRDVELQIDYVVTTAANVQAKDPQIKSIGPWDYGQLDHADRREVRGAGLLAAWLGFWDTRFDNTKLRRVGSKSHPQLVHYFSDLGGGLGRTTGLLAWHGEDVNAFPWTFTEPPLYQGKGRMSRPLRIVGYTPIVPTPAFAAMTIDDARWMGRLIAQLTAKQITDALTASGYDPPTIRLYTEKLISRRNQMASDLGLSAEFPPLKPPDAQVAERK